MTRLNLTKTSFTGGELDPSLFGRVDLRAYGEGAARLNNVVVQPTGGVRRRPGTRMLRELPGIVRLISFDEESGGIVLALGHRSLTVLQNGVPVQASIATPWTEEQVHFLDWTRIGDNLLVCHPDVEPQLLRRDMVGDWLLRRWTFEDAEEADGVRSLRPFARYASPEVALQAQHPDFSPEQAIPTIWNDAPVFVQLVASDSFFLASHYGVRLRLKGREVEIVNVIDTWNAVARVLRALVDAKTTRHWDEEAFSTARGWPVAVTQYQNRLVLGGSKALPDQLWFSRIDDPFNFDTGEGFDDEAIVFRLRADRLHGIRHLFPGRRLQVFTTAGEWVVNGTPLTPTSLSVEPQTSVGCPHERRIRPVDVDGATLFIGASGRDLREFLFTDTEQAYQAADLALLSRHLLLGAREMAFDPLQRTLLIVRDDGGLAAVTIDRNSNVAAWSGQATRGSILSILLRGEERLLLVDRFGKTFLEAWDAGEQLDHVRVLESPVPKLEWAGLDDLEGQAVEAVLDDGAFEGLTVSGGKITLSRPSGSIRIGMRYTHEVEPLPVSLGNGRGLAPATVYRPVRLAFKLLETGTFTVDTGTGAKAVPLPGDGPVFTGDLPLRAFGWRRASKQPLWRIEQDEPVPFQLLSVVSEIKVND